MFLTTAQAIHSDVSRALFGQLSDLERGRLIDILAKLIGHLILFHGDD